MESNIAIGEFEISHGPGGNWCGERNSRNGGVGGDTDRLAEREREIRLCRLLG